MQIKKLLTSDFQGLSGKREFSLSPSINALIRPNGSGKSSFLNAIRYGLTGAVPNGELINRSASSSAVQIEMADGHKFCRQAERNKPANYFMDGKRCTLKELSAGIEKSTGVPSDTLSVVSSADVLSAMKPKEFSDFLLSYIPMKLNAESVIAFLGDADEGVTQSVRAFFKDREINFDAIEEFHAQVCDKRYAAKKALAQCEAVIKTFGNAANPGENREAIEEKIAELKKIVDQITVYNGKKADYEKAKKQIDERQVKIKALEEQIAANESSEPTDDIKKYDEVLASFQKELQEAGKTYQTLMANVETFKKALENLKGNYCPLSKKIVCTTDKTGIIAEVELSIQDNESAAKRQIDAGNDIRNKMNLILKAREAFVANETAYKQKKALMEQLKIMKEAQSLLPECPKPVENADAVIKEYEETRKVLSNMDNYKMLEEAKKNYPIYKKNVDILETLAKLFASNGIVRESINKSYSEVFETRCNLIADELRPGMRFKFVSENGINVFVSVREDGPLVPFKALSNGEKIYALYVLLDMINDLTGSKILVMDELSVLDEGSFREFVKVLKAHVNEYDQVFIAMADHDDMNKVLKEEGIAIVNV